MGVAGQTRSRDRGNTGTTGSRGSVPPEAATRRPLSHWFRFHYSLCFHFHRVFTIWSQLLNV